MKYLNIIYFTIIVSLTFSCDPKTSNSVSSEEEEKIDTLMLLAEETYSAFCSGCHGQQMEAFVDRKWKHGKTPEEIKYSIINGYSEAGMPAWGSAFDSVKIDALVAYIQTGIENVEKFGFKAKKLESDTVETDHYTIVLDTVFQGIERPWHMEWLPNGDMLVTERSGTLYRVKSDGSSSEITGVPKVRVKGQDGLFSVLLHPNYEENNWLYLSYSNLQVNGKDSLTTTVISRFLLSGNMLSDKKLILEADPYTNKQVHFGARMAFASDGTLYITVGDRGERDVNPQDLSRMPGKIHRVNDDGTIPNSNPFIGIDSVKSSIYSYGHRNPQGLAFHPETGLLWQHEHGPRGGDEINIIRPGKNYGWPVISYGINYNGTIFTSELEKEGMEQPQHYWVPSIAPCGMTFVTSDRYPDWKGNILAGSLRFQYLNRCEIVGDKVVYEEKMLPKVGRLRSVEEGPDGFIYISVEKPGYVFRLIPLPSS